MKSYTHHSTFFCSANNSQSVTPMTQWRICPRKILQIRI